MEKWCSKCKIIKPLEEFSLHPKGVFGRHPRCKMCRRLDSKIYFISDKTRILANQKRKRLHLAIHLKRRYGMSKEQYEAMLAAQNGACAICGRMPESGKRLSVDHRHSDKKIRGLLCNGCNCGLGYFRDSVELLSKAINYLQL